ncbi:hypothetical protein [Vibrio kanaloae]|uniref:hypothetical protein n=1 Tax=Vibrio kanaloae TaxID=170673 RepID=UPI0011B62531|nr:hypothetical protein [Vibrio kanaloae]
MKNKLTLLSILSSLFLSGCNSSSPSIPEKQIGSDLDFNKSQFSPKNEQWLNYEEKINRLDGDSSEVFYIKYIPKNSIELIDVLDTLPQKETAQLTEVINNLSNIGVDSFYVRIIKNSIGSNEDTDFLYEKDGQLYRINEEASLSLIDFFNKAPSLIHIFDSIEFPTSANTYKDQQISSSFWEHNINGLDISDEDAYRLVEQYDVDPKMVISRCSLNWKREQKRIENGKIFEKINNQQIEVGLLEYQSILTLECNNDEQPSSSTLINENITTIYHPVFGYVRHSEISGLEQATLTLQDLKWTKQ